MKEYVGIYIKTKKKHRNKIAFATKGNITSTKQPYISIYNWSKGKTKRSDTNIRLLCGSGISFSCQSHLVPVLFRVFDIYLCILVHFLKYYSI